MFRRACVPPPFFVILGPAFLVINSWESFLVNWCELVFLEVSMECTSVFVVFCGLALTTYPGIAWHHGMNQVLPGLGDSSGEVHAHRLDSHGIQRRRRRIRLETERG